MSTPDRFDLMHEQYLDDWIEDNRRHQYEACGIEVPVEAEVQAILRAWENGSDQKPWENAAQSLASCRGGEDPRQHRSAARPAVPGKHA